MSKTFQKPIVYILLFIICIGFSTNYFKVYRLNNSYAQITLLDTDTQKTIKGRGVVGTIAAGILYGAEAFTLGVLIYRSVDSKGKVVKETKEYRVGGYGWTPLYIDDIKFTGDSVGTEKRADGLLCAAMMRQHLGIDTNMDLSDINDMVNNLNDKLKKGNLGEKLDIKENGGLFYHTIKDADRKDYFWMSSSSDKQARAKERKNSKDIIPSSSEEYKIIFDYTSAMWNKLLTADDGFRWYDEESGKAFSFEMVPLGSANADEIITDMIKNKHHPVIALVDLTGIVNHARDADLCYCVINGITEVLDKSGKLVEKKYNVFIPRKGYRDYDKIPVKDFVEHCVVISPYPRLKNWDYSKYGCWYEKYNKYNFIYNQDLSDGHSGYLGYGTSNPGYYIFVKTK